MPAQNYKIVAQAGIIYSYQPVSIRGFGPYVPKIVINGLTSLEGSLSTHSLTSGQHAEGNDATGLPATWPTLSTARGRVTMKYAVGCALAADRTVTLYDTSGNAYAFTGEVGVAPEWETEACGERCQESVSACMLARMNLTGTHTAISLNGPNHALGWSQNANYPRQEAAYFGNVFSSPPVAYACKGSGADLRPISGRLCIGQRDCPYVNAFQNGGKCDAGCTAHPSGTGYSACTVGGRTFSYPATAWTH